MDLIVLQDLPNQLQSEIIYKRLNEFNLQYKPTYLIKKLNITAERLIRKPEKIFKDQFKGKKLAEEEWIKIMIANPKLIERPTLCWKCFVK